MRYVWRSWRGRCGVVWRGAVAMPAMLLVVLFGVAWLPLLVASIAFSPRRPTWVERVMDVVTRMVDDIDDWVEDRPDLSPAEVDEDEG